MRRKSWKLEKFGEILDLIPHATKITKLQGICSKCENKSIYTHRISNETQQEIIGTNNYIPVCRSCYLKLNKLYEYDNIVSKKGFVWNVVIFNWKMMPG